MLLFGEPGVRLGAGMKRGTVVLFAGPAPLLPTFRYDCTYTPVFMALYLRQLAAWGFAPAANINGGAYRRFSGDLVGLGKGEVLVWQP